MIVGRVITIGIIVLLFMSLYLIDDMVDKRKRNK
jgi:hypothetical protein